MNYYKYRILAFIILCIGTLCVSAHNGLFATELLHNMASCINAEDTINNMPDGLNFRALTYNGIPITVEKQNGMVQNIGYSIFPPRQRQQVGIARSRFVERFTLYADLPLKREKSVEQEMQEERIIFQKGNFNTLKSIATTDTACTIEYSLVNSRYHRMKWSKGTTLICDFAFMANHELLLGAKMIENENNLASHILRTITSPASLTYVYSDSDFKTRSNEDCYTLKGHSYIIDDLTSERFFRQNLDGSFSPIFSAKNPKESFANLMTGNDINNEYVLKVALQKYNCKQEEFEIPLSNWLAYCMSNNCTPYCGIISSTNGIIDGLVIMRNEDMGYNHVMRVKFSPSTIPDKRGVITARLYAFVPTSNIKDLYYERIKK